MVRYMNTPHFLTDNSHISLSGVTGSGKNAGGKTATTNWMLSTLVEKGHYNYAVAFDPKGGQYNGTMVVTPEQAANAISNGENILNWTITDIENVEQRHSQAFSFADGLAGSVVFAHDDAVMYADSGALKNAIALAGNPGPGDFPIKSIVVSQDMWDLPRKSIRSNINNLGWVGMPTAEMTKYFKVMGQQHISDVIEKRHTKPFMWSVYDGTTVHTYNPVPSKFAL